MVNLIDLISSKIELFRLEQRYTKRRNRRSTFVSDAQYVDGEYIYNIPSPTNKRHSVVHFSSHESSSDSSGSRESVAEEATSPREGQGEQAAPGARKSRWNSARAFKRRSMVTVQEVRWEEGVENRRY